MKSARNGGFPPYLPRPCYYPVAIRAALRNRTSVLLGLRRTSVRIPAESQGEQTFEQTHTTHPTKPHIPEETFMQPAQNRLLRVSKNTGFYFR